MLACAATRPVPLGRLPERGERRRDRRGARSRTVAEPPVQASTNAITAQRRG